LHFFELSDLRAHLVFLALQRHQLRVCDGRKMSLAGLNKGGELVLPVLLCLVHFSNRVLYIVGALVQFAQFVNQGGSLAPNALDVLRVNLLQLLELVPFVGFAHKGAVTANGLSACVAVVIEDGLRMLRAVFLLSARAASLLLLLQDIH
jgi:hypothetical protein